MDRTRRILALALAALVALSLQLTAPLPAVSQEVETRAAPPLALQYTTTVRETGSTASW